MREYEELYYHYNVSVWKEPLMILIVSTSYSELLLIDIHWSNIEINIMNLTLIKKSIY